MKQYIKLISLIVWLLATYITVTICFDAHAGYVEAKDNDNINNIEVIEENKTDEIKEDTKKDNVNKEVVSNKEELINEVSLGDNKENNQNIITDNTDTSYKPSIEPTLQDKTVDPVIPEEPINPTSHDINPESPVTPEEPLTPELPVTPIIEDVFLIDIKDVSVLSGEIDELKGNILENKRRIYTKNYYKVKKDSYNIEIEDGYIISIYEYDSNKNYLNVIKFDKDSIYNKSSNVSYIRVGLRASLSDVEKTLSLGQWSGKLKSGLKAKVTSGDLSVLNEYNKQITITSTNTYSQEQIMNNLLNDEDIDDMLWSTSIYNGKYNLDVNKFDFINRKTYYISPDGDDDNSGLLKEYPKKTFNSLSGVNNINILFECGKTYYYDGGFNVGSNVTIASYGEGTKPIIKFYQKLNNKFNMVADNIFVTDLSNISSLYNGKKDKSDCNIGHLMINGEVNWKRIVFSSDDEYSHEMLTKNKDELSWVVDYKNGLLYIYTNSDPNNMNIEFAPAVTGFSSTGNNIIIQGIGLMGAGNHAINFTNTSNVNINNCSFKYIGGSVIKSGGARYGNAIQFWNSTNNVLVENNYARWIFDTCYTIQGNASDMTVRNNRFTNNIGVHSQWGLELWGGSKETNSNNIFDNNILMFMGDITNPYTKMQVSGSGHLYGEKSSDNYISYRYGYTFQQGANLALWFPNECYLPDIYNNVFWGTNRFLVIGTWYSNEVNISSLKNNLFYEDYHLSYDTKAALYKFKYEKNNYYTSINNIVSNDTNTESIHSKGTYNNSSDKEYLASVIEKIIKSV